jgi:DNA-binding PadR family transcriptional regulator
MSALQEPTFLILTALAADRLHGYGIIQAVAELSGGQVRLRPGTLYPALDRLTGDGLIDLVHEEIVDGRLRRYYGLTDAGADRLADEVTRLRRNADAAEAALVVRPTGAAEPANGTTGAAEPTKGLTGAKAARPVPIRRPGLA